MKLKHKSGRYGDNQKKTTHIESKIHKYFPKKALLDLEVVSLSNNDYIMKNLLIEHILKKYDSTKDFINLGSGTNRIAFMYDGYVYKIALDMYGRIDNARELQYTHILYPYCVRTYEMISGGIMIVQEYVEPFEISDMMNYDNRIKRILSEILSMGFLVGDVGSSTKNYKNWGKRATSTGSEICMLDYAYVYNKDSSIFRCWYCDSDYSGLSYNDSYDKLICPNCGRTYSFENVLNGININYLMDDAKGFKDGDSLYITNKPIATFKYNKKADQPDINDLEYNDRLSKTSIVDINVKYTQKLSELDYLYDINKISYSKYDDKHNKILEEYNKDLAEYDAFTEANASYYD